MKIEDLNGKIRKLDLPEEQKDAILGLIDTKTNYDVEKLILTIDSFRNEFNTKTDSLRNEMKTENKTVLWVIGVAMAIIALLITAIGIIITMK